MNEHERYLFDLQGYLTVPNALTPDQLKVLNALVDEQIARHMPPEKQTHRFGGLLSWGKPFLDLIDNPRITPYLIALLGERFRLDHDYADVIRSGLSPIGATLHGGGTPFDPSQYYHTHRDRLYNGLTVVAYNLHDVNPGDGGFACVPGSHKSNFPFPEDWRDLREPAPCVASVTGPAGTAIIFTEALTHGPLPWRGAHERRTLFLKYCPHPVAWSRHYYQPDDFPELTEEQRRILSTPGVYPK
jgi:hypothetical protein